MIRLHSCFYDYVKDEQQSVSLKSYMAATNKRYIGRNNCSAYGNTAAEL
jgi:hypothetical protein